MKTVLITLFCFVAFNAFAQTSETITEEKSSAWIRVVEDPTPVSKPTVKKQTNTSSKKPSVTKTSAPKKETQEEFEKTNQQVNRFKKAKKE